MDVGDERKFTTLYEHSPTEEIDVERRGNHEITKFQFRMDIVSLRLGPFSH
jgi:hypothetical protein